MPDSEPNEIVDEKATTANEDADSADEIENNEDSDNSVSENGGNADENDDGDDDNDEIDEEDEDDDDDDEDEDDREDDEEDDGEEEDVEENDDVGTSRSKVVDDSDSIRKSGSPASEVKTNKKRKKKEKSKKTKKRRKTGIERLFNLVAEESDEDDDEEDDREARENGEIVTTKDELEAIRIQEEGRKRYKEMYGGMAEDIARRYDDLFEAQAIEESRFEAMDNYYVQNTQVAQQSLLPSAKDPKIFMIKCTPSKEESLVMAVMNKTIDVYEKTKIMKVKSAFCGSARGYVFIEAVSDTLVREIILGLKGLYMNKIQQLPVHHMTSVLKVKVMIEPIKVGDFVRIKRGPLKGDLVRILALKDGHTKAEIQAVPRIDYEEEKRALSGEATIKVNAGTKVRPSAQLFNAELAFSISETDIDRDQKQGMYQWRGNTYKDGFLLKTVDVNAYIQRTNINPTLEELKLFADLADREESHQESSDLYRPADVNKQLKLLLNNLEGIQAIPYVPGDMIQVLSGELVGLIGRVLVNYEARKVLSIESISPKMDTILEIEESLVTKYIEVGAHVKVMGGQYIGHTGRVVAMNMSDSDPIAVVVSDGSKSEMYCNVSLLQVTDEIAVGRSTLGGFQKDDLVQLSENEVGMVIDVGLEALRILTQLENVKDIHPNEVRSKIDPRKAQKVFDVDQKSFGVGDSVQVISGPHEKFFGTVRHVYKGAVWLYNDNYYKNSGVMVVKPRTCRLVGSLHTGRPSSTLAAAAPSTGMNADSGRNSQASTPTSLASRQQSTGGQTAGGRGRGRPRDALIGKTVRITQGPYRGLSAQVVNGEGGFYQLEILAKMKKVTLPSSKFIAEGDERGRIAVAAPGVGSDSTANDLDRASLGMRTPAYNGSETPHVGSETPFTSSETPLHNIMFTPRRPDDADSSNWGDMDADMSSFGTPAHHHTQPSSSASTAHSASASATTATAAPRSNTSADSSTWVENMVVLVKSGAQTGRLAVIKQLPTASDPNIVVQQRDGFGKLIGSEFSLPVSSVSTDSKPSKGATVKILSGQFAGTFAVMKMAMQNRLILDVNGGTTTSDPSQILWINNSN